MLGQACGLLLSLIKRCVVGSCSRLASNGPSRASTLQAAPQDSRLETPVSPCMQPVSHASSENWWRLHGGAQCSNSSEPKKHQCHLPLAGALIPFTNVAPAEWRKPNSVIMDMIDPGRISSPVAAEPVLYGRMRVESKKTANICKEAQKDLSVPIPRPSVRGRWARPSQSAFQAWIRSYPQMQSN